MPTTRDSVDFLLSSGRVPLAVPPSQSVVLCAVLTALVWLVLAVLAPSLARRTTVAFYASCLVV